VTGEGIEECRRLLADALHVAPHAVCEGAVMMNARQREAVASASAALARCKSETESISETIDRADILAFELREALDALGAVAGAVTTEELLGRVFARFCIGK
jgi:tRNA modification GTPase